MKRGYGSIACLLIVLPLLAGWSRHDAQALADRPSAVMVEPGRCLVTGAVMENRRPVSLAKVYLTQNGSDIGSATTNYEGIYQQEVGAQSGDVIQEVAVQSQHVMLGSRIKQRFLTMTKKAKATCRSTGVSVGDIESI